MWIRTSNTIYNTFLIQRTLALRLTSSMNEFLTAFLLRHNSLSLNCNNEWVSFQSRTNVSTSSVSPLEEGGSFCAFFLRKINAIGAQYSIETGTGSKRYQIGSALLVPIFCMPFSGDFIIQGYRMEGLPRIIIRMGRALVLECDRTHNGMYKYVPEPSALIKRFLSPDPYSCGFPY